MLEVKCDCWKLYLKRTWGQSFTRVFTVYFWFYGEKLLNKVFWRLVQISRRYVVTMFRIQCRWRHFPRMYTTFLAWTQALRPTYDPWWMISWEKLNKLYAFIGFPVLEREGLQHANRADWKGLARYFKEEKQLLPVLNMIAI